MGLRDCEAMEPRTIVLARGAEVELLERVESLAALEGALGDVTESSRGRLVLVRGEAGVGKTAVVRRFCEAPAWRTRILWGACEALFTPRPLGPLAEVALLTDGELEEVVGHEAAPHQVLSALTDEVAKQSPTVLVLEDLHWADEATLDVFRLLGRRIDRFPALVVATYRDDELDGRHPLRVVLGELARVQDVESLDIVPLSRGAVALLAEPYGVDADELYRTTGGNPFYVSEVLAAATREIPSTVRDAVLARAAGLRGNARILLEALTVAPAGMQVGLLEAIAGDATGCLEECIGSGMVVAAGSRVAFRHELARLVIDESIAPDRRVALHAKALRVTSDSADDALLAYHAEAAGDADAVLRFAPQAARRASAVGAHRESAAQYARALRFAEALAPAERAELLERRSYECILTDQTDEAIDTLRTAIGLRRELGDPKAEGAALYQLSEVLWCPGRVAEAREAALQAIALLERLPPGRELAMAYARLAAVCMDAEDVDGTILWGTRTIELGGALGETEIVVHSMCSLGTARFLNGEDAGREQLEHSLVLAQEAELDEQVGRAMNKYALIAQRHRDYALAAEYLEPALVQASERGLELWRGYLLGYRAQIELDHGRWQEAIETATQVLREPRRSRIPRIIALTVVGRVRARRGDPEVWALLDEALALAERGEEVQADAPVAAARAEAAWLEGNRDAVARATDRTLALARRRGSRWIVSELGSWRRRAELIDRLSHGETTGPYRLELAGQWAAAAAQWQELGCPYEAALALAEDDDQNLVRQALDQLHALGAQPAAAIVARRLRQRGARRLPRGPRSRTRSNPAGLTARELEILPMLADGLRNAQIAKRLVVSPRTIDHHVSAILQKLDVKTRGEAAAEATRLGLTHPT